MRDSVFVGPMIPLDSPERTKKDEVNTTHSQIVGSPNRPPELSQQSGGPSGNGVEKDHIDSQEVKTQEDFTICTIICKNYLAHARCLVNSFLDHHPGGRAFVLLCDRLDDCFDPTKERFTTIEVELLGIPSFEALSFRYTLLELTTAVKPFFLEHLLRVFHLRKICYFDPDILILGGLDDLFATLDEVNIAITPHLLDSLDDDRYPSELNILQAGSYNLGFIGLSDTREVDRFLAWWQRRLLVHCTTEPDADLFVDQRWIDLVPGMFSGVSILRNPGYNVAYWNLKNRNVVKSPEGYLVNGIALKFFHFSGFVMEDIQQVSKHQNRFQLGNLPELVDLFTLYRDKLNKQGYHKVKPWPYSFGTFDDGVTIPDSARRAYREVDPKMSKWTRPYSTRESNCFRNWLNSAIDEASPHIAPITRLAYQVYKERVRLQVTFPDVFGQHRTAFVMWFVANAEKELVLDSCFVEPMLRSSRRPKISKFELDRDLQYIDKAIHPEYRSELGIFHRIYISTLAIIFRFAQTHWGRNLRIIFEKMVPQRITSRLLTLGPPQPIRTHPMATQVVDTRQNPTDQHNHQLPFGMNVVGYLRSETGVGEIARGTIRALQTIGFPVAKRSISLSDFARGSDYSCDHIADGNPFRINLFHVNADQVPIVMETLGHKFLKGHKNIGYWFWELDRFPEQWWNCFSVFDEIWVASSFLQATLAPLSPVPIVRMRPCVEIDPVLDFDREEFGLPPDRFVFLFSFDAFSIPERKNPFALIAAFRRAFGTHSKEAFLVLKVNRLNQISGNETILGVEPGYAVGLGSAVEAVSGTLINEYLDRDRVLALYAASDAFVSLHRSEGFGLSIAEAMLLGKPCIATSYSSNLEFMNPQNSYLIDYRLIELERDYGPYMKGSVWAEPDVDHAASLMRHVFENREEAYRKGQNARADINRSHCRLTVGEAIRRRAVLISR